MRRPSARLANRGTVERPPLGVKIHETVCRDALDGSGLLELPERRSKPRVQIFARSNSLVARVEGVGNTVVANGACCASMAG